MENFYSTNSPWYPKTTDKNRHSQLMNAHVGSPFDTRSGGYYNPKLLMSSPYETYRCDNAENIDPQILMSLNSSSSSSGDNFSSPSAVNRVRYRGGYDRSPLSLVESSGNSNSASASKPPFVVVNTPLCMEDDVLVMDEVFVMNALGGKSRTGKDTSGSSASSVQSYKMDVCSSWAEIGSCRFGSNCQFSHSKEDPSLCRFSNKGKPELEICFPQNRLADSYSLSSFKVHSSRPGMSRGAVAYGRSPQGSGTVGNFRRSPADGSGSGSGDSRRSPADGSGSGDSRRSIAPKDSRSPMTSLDWMPQDDGINAMPPGSPNLSRHEVLKYINNYLYAPRVKSRLPVFTAICPAAPAAAAAYFQQMSPDLN